MKLSITIHAALSELSKVRESVSGFIGNGLDDIDRGRVILAIDEAVSNVITHGYRSDETETLEIEMVSDDRSFTFSIIDRAESYNPLENPPADIENYYENGKDTGFGVDVYSRIMKVYYEKNGEKGNRLILVKEKKNEDK